MRKNFQLLSPLLLIALSACGSKTITTNAVTLGFLFPYTNSQAAPIATVTEAGVRIAQTSINKAGGLLGAQVQVKTYDVQGDGNTFMAQLEQAVEIDHVSAVIGDLSALSDPNDIARVVGLLHQHQIVMADLGGGDEFTNTLPNRDFLFRMLTADTYTTLSNAIGKDWAAHMTKLAIVGPPGSDGGPTPQLISAWQHYSSTSATPAFINYPLLSDYSTWDATTTAQAIEDANIDGVYFAGGELDTDAIVTQLRTNGKIKPVYFLGSLSPVTTDQPPGSRAGFRAANIVLPDPNSNLVDFGTAYKNWNNGTPITDAFQIELAAQSFDPAMWLALAVAKAGTTEGTKLAAAMPTIFDPAGTPVNTTDIAAAFTALKSGPILYRTALRGQLSLDAYHDAEVRLAVYVSDDNGVMVPETIYPPGQPQ